MVTYIYIYIYNQPYSKGNGDSKTSMYNYAFLCIDFDLCLEYKHYGLNKNKLNICYFILFRLRSSTKEMKICIIFLMYLCGATTQIHL